MRWGRKAKAHANRGRQAQRRTAGATQTIDADALEEARKGTAAAHPAIVVTPDKKAHSGAFVAEGVFVEARESPPRRKASPQPQAQHAKDVAEGEVPGENPAMQDKRWVRSGHPNAGADEDET